MLLRPVSLKPEKKHYNTNDTWANVLKAEFWEVREVRSISLGPIFFEAKINYYHNSWFIKIKNYKYNFGRRDGRERTFREELKVRPRREEGVGSRSVGSRRVGSPKLRAFFHSPANFLSFFSLWGSSRGVLVVFEEPGP